MSTDNAALADVTSADWSLKLGAIGAIVQGIDDVDQCLAIILTTPLGADPLRPAFGCDLWRFIDYPINSAIPAIVQEIAAAISTWEPRVQLIAVDASPTGSGDTQPGVSIRVTWKLNLGAPASAPNETVITLPRAS
jgi:hypothetical protein